MNVSGDHDGQISNGFRWPFGPVAIVAPFNFPLEIPVLQLMGALMMGNKVVIKGASTTSMVLEQWIRLLHECGLPMEDVDLIHCGGRVMGELLVKGPYRITQFTGSSGVSEDLCHQTNGKVRVEDAGFDWKIVGPDVVDADYVAWQCDQDAYAATGQKCSAESVLFMHKNWVDAGLEGKLKTLAERRSLDDLTIGAVLSETTKGMLDHCANLLAIPGARLCWGGKELESHTIPEVYGAIEPTAVFVPITEMVKDEYFNDCVTEIFGPFQVLTEYTDEQLPLVLEMCERMSHHLTAAVVSNDVRFTNHVLGNTVNGTTYAGIRARTTGAPQNHWFGPAGDPRGAGIGTPGAIRLVWSCHREIINDNGNIPAGWTTPPPS
jgi:1-pyrroline-5-carboxylate dehydrogenase